MRGRMGLQQQTLQWGRPKKKQKTARASTSGSGSAFVECPVCGRNIPLVTSDEHVVACLAAKEQGGGAEGSGGAAATVPEVLLQTPVLDPRSAMFARRPVNSMTTVVSAQALAGSAASPGRNTRTGSIA